MKVCYVRRKKLQQRENFSILIILMTSGHAQSHAPLQALMAISRTERSLKLAQFITQAKGIRLYEVDCSRVQVGMTVILRRSPSRYDINAVDLLVTSLHGNLFFGHLAKEAAQFISPLLLKEFNVTGLVK